MASSKRGRRAFGNGEHLDDDAQPMGEQDARSMRVNETQPRKRARVSGEGDISTDYSSSEDDDREDANRSVSPPRTQYEIMRDAGFKHLRNLEKDDLRATEKLKQKHMRLGDNAVAQSGIIESITCINFMCHENLHVELGPLINFVVGENGSGKSAVLTSLTLCLGGKASDTNRGGSLKSFVKEGQEHGKLIVRIKNAGSDAYQHDVYGDTIIVERHFSRSGGSGFKIKSEHGQIISSKKQEVDEISEWYTLQMGNPLIVLSQDNARQFLNSATPAQKYKYFLSGVQLEQLDNDYKISQDTLDKTLILQDDLKEKINQVKKEKVDAQRLAETVQKNNQLRERYRFYRKQLVWSQVAEQESQIQRQEQRLQECAEAISEAETLFEEKSKALLHVEEKMQTAKAKKDDLSRWQDSFEEKIETADAAFQTAKKELYDIRLEERDAFSRLKSAKTERETCEANIREEEHRLDESSGSARNEKEAELAETTSQEKRLQELIEEQNARLPLLKSELDEAERVLKKHQRLREGKRSDILTAQQGIKVLEQRSGSEYEGFDPQIADLVKAVELDCGFEHKPKGPLGAHIELRKPEWSAILEKTLGDTLNAFVVRSKKDQTRLSGLIRKISMKRPPPIYIAHGCQIDTTGQEPDDCFDTILRVLDFDDQLIRSQLVINGQIEKIILVTERTEAQRIMVDNGPPRNVAACICFHDGKGKRGQGLRITNRSGTIGTSPIIPGKVSPRMRSDSARQVLLNKDNLKQLGFELVELQNEERHAQQALEKCRAQISAHGSQQTKLRHDLRRTQADLERIQSQLDAFEGVDGRLVALRSELESRRAEESQLGSQYGNMGLAKRDLNAKAEEAKRRLDHERDQARDFHNRISKADEDCKRCESLRLIAVSDKNEAFDNLAMAKETLRVEQDRRNKKRDDVESLFKQAQEVAPDRVSIPEGENYESIEKKYEKIGEQLALRQARIGASDQEIYDRANEVQARYDDMVKQARHVRETIDSLKEAIWHRLHLWRQFQRQISARVRIQFNYLLSERGFRGKIDFNHKDRKVIIHIEPDETRRSSSGRNTKTLSGGEKSFSSICMLLSVWEAIGSPIRCLDEFDVFMDNVNRAISTNMLVDAARRSVSRQYILITPNAIEGRARLEKDVKIIRLTDPRQRTLI